MSFFLSLVLGIELDTDYRAVFVLKMGRKLENVVIFATSSLVDLGMLTEICGENIELVAKFVSHIAKGGRHVALGDIYYAWLLGRIRFDQRDQSTCSWFLEIFSNRFSYKSH